MASFGETPPPRITMNIDKHLVAKRFGKSSGSYDAATPVQEAMARHLADTVRREFGSRTGIPRILEIGCGTGRLTRMLGNAFPGARITSLDISSAMVDAARENYPDAEFLAADAETFVQEHDRQYDLIVSNAAMQWFQHPGTTLARCRALLAKEGLMAFSTFGNETFQELRAAFSHAYAQAGKPCQTHVGELAGRAFLQCALPDARIEEQRYRREFPDARSFLRSVQEAGATNSFARSKYIPRSILQDMLVYYESNFRNGQGAGTYCTYHALYLFCRETH